MIFRKDEWVLRRLCGVIVCDKMCLGVVLTSSFLSCDESIFPG